MKCSKCGKKTCVITITRNYERLCDECYDKNKAAQIINPGGSSKEKKL